MCPEHRIEFAMAELGWAGPVVNCSRLGPSHRWTLGGAVAAKVFGGGIFGQAVRTLGRRREGREAKKEK